MRRISLTAPYGVVAGSRGATRMQPTKKGAHGARYRAPSAGSRSPRSALLRHPVRGFTVGYGCHRHNPASRRAVLRPRLSITVSETPYWGCGCTLGCTPLREAQPDRNGRRGAARRFGRRALNPAVARVVADLELDACWVAGGCRVVAGCRGATRVQPAKKGAHGAGTARRRLAPAGPRSRCFGVPVRGIAVGYGCHRHNPALRRRRTATPPLDYGR